MDEEENYQRILNLLQNIVAPDEIELSGQCDLDYQRFWTRALNGTRPEDFIDRKIDFEAVYKLAWTEGLVYSTDTIARWLNENAELLEGWARE